jgi:glycosyltransferase involved in cell wall biosynthesis
MLSIAIPSRNEIFLKKTIEDVLKKATGDIEVFPILDGYDLPDEEIVKDSRVKYIRIPNNGQMQKRHGINTAVSIAKGKYVMSLDAHCMMAKGFDEQLAKDHQDNWVQLPRRNRLNAEDWCLQHQPNKPSIDYEYIMWEGLKKPEPSLHGFRWDARTIEREHILIDDTLTFQGSCWFMTKEWFNQMGFMQIEGYSGWGQEAEEIGLKTRLHGGRLITNKNTWYAHLHKGKKYGRMYFMNKKANTRCYAYSSSVWLGKHKDFFIGLIESFMPIPKFPRNWKDIVWKPQ